MRFLRDNAQTIIVINILLSLLLCGVMLYIDWARKRIDNEMPAYLQQAPRPTVTTDGTDAAPVQLPTPAPRADRASVDAAHPPEAADGQPARTD